MSKITDRVSTTGMAERACESEHHRGPVHNRLGETISKPKAIWQCLVFLRREAVDAELASLANLIDTAADHAAKLTPPNETLDY